MSEDFSNGYEENAQEFIALRSTSGRALVEKWAHTLPSGGEVIDIGAGHGEPLMSVLVGLGLNMYAIDASPTMVAACQARFPGVEIACAAVEHSHFFNKVFDGVLMVGLLFLLPEESQRKLIRKISIILKPGGRFLFSVPHQKCQWTDNVTGRLSRSLGREAYHDLLSNSGLILVGEHIDEGNSSYFEAKKP